MKINLLNSSQLSDESEASNSNNNYLIIGPNIESIPLNSTYDPLTETKKLTKLIGDGKKHIEIMKLDLSNAKNIIIHAHGIKGSSGSHQIELHSYLGFASGVDYTHYNFQALNSATKKTPINLELFSCYSGAAIIDGRYLPINSTLMTFTHSDHSALVAIDLELIEKSMNFIHLNPFMKFASYLLNNPDDSKFFINIPNNHQYFISSMDSLEDFSSEGIKTWQNQQLKKFSKYIYYMRGHSNQKLQDQINETLDVIRNNDDRQKFINQFDTHRYQELLLLNSVNNSNSFEKIHQLLDNGVDIESKTLYGNTSIFFAASRENKELVQLLLDRGCDPNHIDMYNLNSLDAALINKNEEIAKLLIKAGADPKSYKTKQNIIMDMFKEASEDNDLKAIDSLSKFYSKDKEKALIYFQQTKNGKALDHILKQGMKLNNNWSEHIKQSSGDKDSKNKKTL